jgi:hypothetical protein
MKKRMTGHQTNELSFFFRESETSIPRAVFLSRPRKESNRRKQLKNSIANVFQPVLWLERLRQLMNA